MKNKNKIKKVLTIGPDYRFPNGGIAKLLNTYSKIIDNFEFVPTMRALEHRKESKALTFLRMIKGLFLMSYKITFQKYRIIHIHTASGISFLRETIFLYLASFLGAKTIFHMHSGRLDDFYQNHPKLVGRSLKKADKVVTIAKVWEDYLKSKGHTNVVTIGNPINEPNFISVKQERKHINILFLGLICDNKGIWDILEMVKDHRTELSGKIKLFIGGNGEVEKLNNFIEEFHLSDIVEYLGWVNDSIKQSLFSHTDIYLQPSYKEALGIAILEAMSYKIPIVASNTGGIPEIVQDGINGYLIKPGDKESLFIAIEKLSNSEITRKNFGEKGFEIAKKYFPLAIKNQINNLYSNIK